VTRRNPLHFLTVGWGVPLVQELCDRVAARSEHRFSHILHPRHIPSDFAPGQVPDGMHFFRSGLRHEMPEPDPKLLAALEQDGVPTIHNMILGDRVVAKLDYRDALRYATFLAQRLTELFSELNPSIVIGSFDALHSAVSLAIARRMRIPWYAINFSVIPTGLACFCDKMSPASRVQLEARPLAELRAMAEAQLQRFEGKVTRVPAYITPPALSVMEAIERLPARARAVLRTLSKGRSREFWKFTEERSDYSLGGVRAHFRRVRAARAALARVPTLAAPPQEPYVLFGLHMQPESSIDVWAPFYSNQMWVIELIARAMPPSHRILVKIHKSDTANYRQDQLGRMLALPGVQLVEPFADARSFVDRADLIIGIQGTMGLEGALLGKPVIMLGDSPVSLFPSVSTIGAITELPGLIRAKLREAPPPRSAIIEAYASYLRPFLPAGYNDWYRKIPDEEIGNYVRLFDALAHHVAELSAASQMRSGTATA
jgi:hypothetical protein